jgi:GAF domain-containing protein
MKVSVSGMASDCPGAGAVNASIRTRFAGPEGVWPPVYSDDSPLEVEVALGGPLADELNLVFARIRAQVQGRRSLRALLPLIGATAVETVDGAEGAGISGFRRSGRMTELAATSRVVELVDARQAELGEGPCVAAFSGGDVVRVEETAFEERWPRWARAAEDLGLHAALSVPVRHGDLRLGSIQVYSGTPRAFGPRAERVLTLLAAQAAALLAELPPDGTAQRMSPQLLGALRRRAVIARAVRVLIADRGVDEETALAVLIASAQAEEVTLREAAEAVLAGSWAGA